MYLYYYLSNLSTSSWDSFQERAPSVWNIDQDISVLLWSWASRPTVTLNKFNRWKSTLSASTKWAHAMFFLLVFPWGSNALTFHNLIFVTYLYRHTKTLLPWICSIRPPFGFSCIFLRVLEGWISLKRLIASGEQVVFLEHTKTVFSLLRFNCKPECALVLSIEGQKSHSWA